MHLRSAGCPMDVGDNRSIEFITGLNRTVTKVFRIDCVLVISSSVARIWRFGAQKAWGWKSPARSRGRVPDKVKGKASRKPRAGPNYLTEIFARNFQHSEEWASEICLGTWPCVEDPSLCWSIPTTCTFLREGQNIFLLCGDIRTRVSQKITPCLFYCSAYICWPISTIFGTEYIEIISNKKLSICPIRSQISSLDFVINRLFMKLFNSTNKKLLNVAKSSSALNFLLLLHSLASATVFGLNWANCHKRCNTNRVMM